MRNELKIVERIENYLLGKLDHVEQSNFEQELESNQTFAFNVETQRLVIKRLQVISIKEKIGIAHQHYIRNNGASLNGNAGFFLIFATIFLIASFAISPFLFNISEDVIHSKSSFHENKNVVPQVNRSNSKESTKIENRNNLLQPVVIIKDSITKARNNVKSGKHSTEFIKKTPIQPIAKREMELIQLPILPKRRLSRNNSIVLYHEKKPLISGKKSSMFKLDSAMSISKYDKYRSGWALFYRNGLYGFIDQNGNEIVKPQYESIGSFGVYQSHWALVYKDGLYGFIDQKGNEILKPQYESIGSFGVYQSHWALVYKDGLYGFIDQKGNEILKPQYESVEKHIMKTIKQIQH